MIFLYSSIPPWNNWKRKLVKRMNREVLPDDIFAIYELTLRLWKKWRQLSRKVHSKTTAVSLHTRRVRLTGLGSRDPGWPRCCKFQPPDDVVFVFVFALSVCPSRNRKSTCKNTAHPHVFVFVVCRWQNLSNVPTQEPKRAIQIWSNDNLS